MPLQYVKRKTAAEQIVLLLFPVLDLEIGEDFLS